MTVDSWPGWTSLREFSANAIGIGIVLFTGAALWQLMMTDPSMEQARGASTFLGPILGTVLGFYFGAASGERIARDATQRTKEAETQKAEVKQAADTAMATFEDGLNGMLDDPAMEHEIGPTVRSAVTEMSRKVAQSRRAMSAT